MSEDEIERRAATIDLLDERFSGEVEVKLTKGQVVFLTNLVEQNVQARGFRMVQFAFDLMTRLEAINSSIIEDLNAQSVEVVKTVIEPDETTTEKEPSNDDIFTAEESA